MAKLRVHGFAVSVDGFGAGAAQDEAHPLGVGGEALMGWAFATRYFHKMFGQEGGETGVDDDLITAGFENVGAWILGRNMFGPVRGPWPDEAWKGWWGDNPPYHVPVFVLTHYPRDSLVMAGGTVFHFVTEGTEVALARAFEAAGGKDVRVGGGVATVRTYLQAGVVDEMHLAVSPVVLGAGEALFAGMDLSALGYRCKTHVFTANAAHVVIGKEDRV
jgi:dihydrofolate reductase